MELDRGITRACKRGHGRRGKNLKRRPQKREKGIKNLFYGGAGTEPQEGGERRELMYQKAEKKIIRNLKGEQNRCEGGKGKKEQ